MMDLEAAAVLLEKPRCQRESGSNPSSPTDQWGPTQASHCTSQSLSFPVCKMAMRMSASRTPVGCKRKGAWEVLSTAVTGGQK